MVPLVVGDIRLPVKRALTSIAHGYQMIWVLISGSVLNVIDYRAYSGSRSGLPILGGAAHRNSEDGSVDAKVVDMLLSEIGVILGRWSLYCH